MTPEERTYLQGAIAAEGFDNYFLRGLGVGRRVVDEEFQRLRSDYTKAREVLADIDSPFMIARNDFVAARKALASYIGVTL